MGGDRTPPRHYQKHLFILKLQELQAWNSIARIVIDGLRADFRADELEGALADLERNGPPRAIWFETARIIRVLALQLRSDVLRIRAGGRACCSRRAQRDTWEEDARFVARDGDTAMYYAT